MDQRLRVLGAALLGATLLVGCGSAGSRQADRTASMETTAAPPAEDSAVHVSRVKPYESLAAMNKDAAVVAVVTLGPGVTPSASTSDPGGLYTTYRVTWLRRCAAQSTSDRWRRACARAVSRGPAARQPVET